MIQGINANTIIHMQCANKTLDLTQPQVMGILNVTPDSFSDGGQFQTVDKALRHAERMIAEGASIVDVGGESTRPSASPVSIEEEMDRVLPIIDAIAQRLDVIISVDTSKAQIMTSAAAAGAHMLNDVRAFSEPGAECAAVGSGLPLCCMHMQGKPSTMQQAPSYSSVVDEVSTYLLARANALIALGQNPQQLILDPGFGFGKELEHNLQLLVELKRIVQLGCPVLVGLSRKSMIGKLLNDAPIDERSAGSVVAALIAYQNGATLFRVHDVKETVDALTVAKVVSSVSYRSA